MKLRFVATAIIFLLHCLAGTYGDNFLVLGDWGGSVLSPFSTEIERSTAKQMSETADEKNSSFVLALGDNFYTFGVKNEYDPRFEETFSSVFSEPSLQVPWYLVAGNHDHYGNASAQIAYQQHSDIWKFPNYWYSQKFTFKDTNCTMKLVMIDTVLLCGNTGMDDDLLQPQGPENIDIAEDQWSWIEQELQASRDDYLFVGGHFPVWSIAEHGPTKCLVDRLKPLLEQYQVTAYLCGHDHNLQHIKEDESTVHYFVIGAANYVNPSQEHADKVKEEYVKFFWADSSKNGGFASFDVGDEGVNVTLVDSVGEELHQEKLLPRVL